MTRRAPSVSAAGVPPPPVDTPAAPEPTEAQLADTLRDFCRTFPDWRCAHFRPARDRLGRWHTPVAGDGVGFPDWVLAHPRAGVLFVELKSATGRLTVEQARWGRDLIRAGAVWREVRGKKGLNEFLAELNMRAVRR